MVHIVKGNILAHVVECEYVTWIKTYIHILLCTNVDSPFQHIYYSCSLTCRRNLSSCVALRFCTLTTQPYCLWAREAQLFSAIEETYCSQDVVFVVSESLQVPLSSLSAKMWKLGEFRYTVSSLSVWRELTWWCWCLIMGPEQLCTQSIAPSSPCYSCFNLLHLFAPIPFDHRAWAGLRPRGLIYRRDLQVLGSYHCSAQISW